VRVEPDVRHILNKLRVNPDSSYADQINSIISRAARRCEVNLSYRIDSLRVENSTVYIDNDLSIHSDNLSSLLYEFDRCVLMASAAADAVIRKIQKLTEQENMHEAQIYDAVASECVDAGFEHIRRIIDVNAARHGLQMIDKRFSPGYGDVELEIQKDIFEKLNLSQLGLSILPSCMMQPTKSATAISGLRRVKS